MFHFDKLNDQTKICYLKYDNKSDFFDADTMTSFPLLNTTLPPLPFLYFTISFTLTKYDLCTLAKPELVKASSKYLSVLLTSFFLLLTSYRIQHEQ